MRTPIRLAPLVVALFAGAAFGGEPPPEGKKPVPTRLPVVSIPGIHWEREFSPALPRAAAEGRPVLFAVNALVDQGERGNVEAATVHYPSKELGDASRLFVCLVGNPNDHEARTLADGTVVCSRYGNGTCQGHKDALAWLLRTHSSDGESVISPSHWVFEPDGALFSHGDFVQSTPTPSDLEMWAVAISPRLAVRRVWTVREAKMAALEKGPTADLEKAAREWATSGDAMAAAGLVALLDQERDGTRRKALASAIKACGPAAAAPLFDLVDAGTSAPDSDSDAALFWVDLAKNVSPDLGAFAAGRVVARSRVGKTRSRAISVATGFLANTPPDPRTLAPPLRAALAEARLLAGDREATGDLDGDAKDVLPAARVERARRAAGAIPPADLAAVSGRDALRTALYEASAEAVNAAREKVVGWLSDPAIDVRVAAAVALRRAGNVCGAGLLLWALSDPVEGPEARAALAALNGGVDLGEDPSAWEEFLRSPTGGPK